MAGSKRTKEQIERDYAVIAEMYCLGHTQAEIADFLNSRENNPPKYSISRVQVGSDIKEIKTRWLDSALIDFDQRMAQELAKIDNLERMYHQAYAVSLEGVDMEEEGTNDKGKYIKSRKTKAPEGNLKALDGVAKCIEMRCRILGINKDTLDITSGGKKIEQNIIVLPNNHLNENGTAFNKEKLEEMIELASIANRSSD